MDEDFRSSLKKIHVPKIIHEALTKELCHRLLKAPSCSVLTKINVSTSSTGASLVSTVLLGKVLKYCKNLKTFKMTRHGTSHLAQNLSGSYAIFSRVLYIKGVEFFGHRSSPQQCLILYQKLKRKLSDIKGSEPYRLKTLWVYLTGDRFCLKILLHAVLSGTFGLEMTEGRLRNSVEVSSEANYLINICAGQIGVNA